MSFRNDLELLSICDLHVQRHSLRSLWFSRELVEGHPLLDPLAVALLLPEPVPISKFCFGGDDSGIRILERPSMVDLGLVKVHSHSYVVAPCWLLFAEIAVEEPDLWAVSADPHVALFWEISPNVLMEVSVIDWNHPLGVSTAVYLLCGLHCHGENANTKTNSPHAQEMQCSSKKP